MPKLILLNEDGVRSEIPIGAPTFWIGRSRENALPITDKRASRRHCCVAQANGIWELRDEGSANGTLLNGKIVDRAALEPGDLIEIGETRIFFAEVNESRLEDSAEITRALGDVRENREQMNLMRLQRIARVLNGELELEKLLEMILDHAIDIVQAERGFLILKTPAGGIEFASSRNFAGDAVTGSELEISRSLAGRVLEEGKPVCAVNALEDEDTRDIQSISILGLRSVLCIPLRAKDATLGAIYLDNRLAKRAFGDRDLRMLEALADQAAVALRNAQLFAQSKESARELAEARERVEALNRRLEAIVRGQNVELNELREAHRARESLGTKYQYDEIIGRSPAILTMLRLVDRVVDSDVPVHIFGESGTGKELVAQAIHRNGPRQDGPFVSENCAALTETLLESELFGYVKGAFTGAERSRKGLFELADTGSLFLDEVGDMSQGMQRKLLRVLQEGEVRRVGGIEAVKIDVRIVSASNRDLRGMVEVGEFRQDLYYRLRVLQIHMPPLRDRREDIPLLVSHFFDRESKHTGARPKRLAGGVMDQLMAYDWPGNVRELENECLRMLALSSEVVEEDVLSEQIRGFVPTTVSTGPPDEVRDLNDLVRQIEVGEIKKALRIFRNNKTKAADALCISRFALQRKLEKYEIPLDD